MSSVLFLQEKRRKVFSLASIERESMGAGVSVRKQRFPSRRGLCSIAVVVGSVKKSKCV